MANLAKDTAFSGAEKFFPEESQEGAKELVRRLGRFSNSLIDRLRVQPTIYTNLPGDPPVGTKAGDVWINEDGIQIFR